MTECEPRWSSPRTGRRSSGAAVAKVAKQLGVVLLPWQRRVVDVALEQGRSRPAYRDVLVSVPRQQGKSSLALALIVSRMLAAPDTRVLYSAQTRQAAREKLLSSWWPQVARSELGDLFNLFRGFGSETLLADNGSSLQLLSATESAGHGETTDLVIVDEAWVHQDSRVEQAVRPTMATRPAAQFWAMSTAGTARSTWWRAKLDAGRAAAEMGVSDGLCLLEWGAPESANPADEATWRSAMPALGHLIDVETVRADMASMAVGEFARAFLNVWPDPAGEGWRVFDQQKWRAARE